MPELNQQPSLLEAIKTMTPEEASNPKVVAGVVVLCVIEQIMQTDALENMSAVMSEKLAWLTAEVFAEKPDLSQVLWTACLLTDAVAFRTGNSKCELERRAREVEQALIRQKLGKEAR